MITSTGLLGTVAGMYAVSDSLCLFCGGTLAQAQNKTVGKVAGRPIPAIPAQRGEVFMMKSAQVAIVLPFVRD